MIKLQDLINESNNLDDVNNYITQMFIELKKRLPNIKLDKGGRPYLIRPWGYFDKPQQVTNALIKMGLKPKGYSKPKKRHIDRSSDPFGNTYDGANETTEWYEMTLIDKENGFNVNVYFIEDNAPFSDAFIKATKLK